MSIAVFDVGGTFIKYCQMNKGKMSLQGKVPTPYDDQETFLQTIEKIIEKMEDVNGIAFSLPGVIDVERKYIFAGGSLAYNNQTDVKEWEKRFQLPIEIENDARCAAIAELECGHMQGIKNGLVLTFGTGVGGAVIINGDIYKGSHLIGGEASIIFSKDRQKYGSKALFGTIGSVVNLVENIALAKNSTTRDGKKIFKWIADGDKTANAIFHQYCQDVVKELHNIQCLLDPQRICIGGGVSENPLFIETLKKVQDDFYQDFPFHFPRAEIMKCCYCNDANMIGAYHHYLKKNAEI